MLCLSLIILCTELLKFLLIAVGGIKCCTALNVKAQNTLYYVLHQMRGLKCKKNSLFGQVNFYLRWIIQLGEGEGPESGREWRVCFHTRVQPIRELCFFFFPLLHLYVFICRHVL